MRLRLLPMVDLWGDGRPSLWRDALAALAVGVLALPQGVAYAMVAGLPPAMGLYASVAPAVVGALFRSSRHVVTGPTNAVSLLVGSAVVISSATPAETAVTLAFLVGLAQAAAGLLRLGAVIDYISSSVVLGYITGAAVLIGVGQLSNITGTPRGEGALPAQVWGWLEGVWSGPVEAWSVGIALGTAVLLLVLGRAAPQVPWGVLSMVAGTALSRALDLSGQGVRVIADIAPIPAGLPPLVVPDLSLAWGLWPAAVACTVLSLVESSAVARSMAQRTGQRLDASVEFWGQGLANLAAAVTGGYPTSGSPVRSTLNVQAGARSRLSGVLSGGVVLLALLWLGPLLDATPVASLAGLLLAVAVSLVDVGRIRRTLWTLSSDSSAFLATLLGTWVLPLDQAIYLGVGISVVLFLRRARLLTVQEVGVSEQGRLREFPLDQPPRGVQRCDRVRILHIEGTLFFGSAGELRSTLEHAAQPGVGAVVVRLKRTRGMDITTIEALEAAASVLSERGVRLVLVGLGPKAMERLHRSGGLASPSAHHGHEQGEGEGGGGGVRSPLIYPAQQRWFGAMNEALADTVVQVGGVPASSPLWRYLSWGDRGAPSGGWGGEE